MRESELAASITGAATRLAWRMGRSETAVHSRYRRALEARQRAARSTASPRSTSALRDGPRGG